MEWSWGLWGGSPMAGRISGLPHAAARNPGLDAKRAQRATVVFIVRAIHCAVQGLILHVTLAHQLHICLTSQPIDP